MSRFTRIEKDGAGQPKPHASRLYGEQVSVGEPLQLHGDADLRKQVESTLEIVARERLQEAENQAAAIIEDAQGEAARILERANAQAREMLATAQGQVDGITETAHESGFKTGFQEGYDDATEQVQRETIELLQGAHVLAEGAYAAERRILKEFEAHAAQIIAHVVRRILKRELADSPETLLALVNQAIESLYLTGKVKVVVNAQIIQDLRAFTEQTRQTLDGMSRFEFVADPGLELHQIYIVGQEGSFDISPETQAQQLLTPIAKHLDLPRPQADLQEKPSSSGAHFYAEEQSSTGEAHASMPSDFSAETWAPQESALQANDANALFDLMLDAAPESDMDLDDEEFS